MIHSPSRVMLNLATFLLCGALWMQGATKAQNSRPPAFSSEVQNMGPVGEEGATPSEAAPPSNSVVDPGIIPSQAITPALSGDITRHS
jgi:hypothetical protein